MSYTGTCYAVDPKKSIRVVPYCWPTEPHSQRRLGTSLARWHVCDLLGQRINKWRLRATVLSWTVSPDVERKPVNRCVKCCTNRFHKSLIVSQQPNTRSHCTTGFGVIIPEALAPWSFLNRTKIHSVHTRDRHCQDSSVNTTTFQYKK